MADEVQDDIPKSPWLGYQCVINHWSGFSGKGGFQSKVSQVIKNFSGVTKRAKEQKKTHTPQQSLAICPAKRRRCKFNRKMGFFNGALIGSSTRNRFQYPNIYAHKCWQLCQWLPTGALAFCNWHFAFGSRIIGDWATSRLGSPMEKVFVELVKSFGL